ncbi:serine/threonine-protein kinase 16 isoform X2 [Bacillus rossius redtenbacheri]
MLAQAIHSCKYYAIKRIICHDLDDQDIGLKEVEYYGLVKHPNIIECVDSSLNASCQPGANFMSEVLIVLPYYKKGTLQNELDLRRIAMDHMPATEILSLFLQICEGVKAFHEAVPEPLAHRDLKTANIALTDDNKPVIIDLGSVAPARVKVSGSCAAHRLQDVASERCSMPYRAPELFNVESHCSIDERTDIWSLGCILYAMCYFKSPFDAVYERGDSVALAVMSGVMTFPKSSIYNEEIHNLISYMLKVNPVERPYIYDVIQRTQDVYRKLEGNV